MPNATLEERSTCNGVHATSGKRCVLFWMHEFVGTDHRAWDGEIWRCQSRLR